MASGILDTAVSGLTTLQRSLQTVSHNIANVNTEGYSRQRVEAASNDPQRIGGGFIGKGVHIANIIRQYDEFTTRQFRASQSAFNDADSYRMMAERVDSLVASEDTSLAPVMKQFFNAMNDVANDPVSIPARQTLLAESNNLVSRFDLMQSRFKELRSQVNTDLKNAVNDINQYARSIADLNRKIAEQGGSSGVAFKVNDLMDRRDLLISQLSEVIDVAVVPGDNNALNIFIGQGQPVVLTNNAMPVNIQASTLDRDQLEIGFKDPATGDFTDVTRQLSGGKLTGLIRFRDEVLLTAQQQLGQLAASFALEVNQQHKAGYDLDGAAGLDLFSGVNSVSVSADPGNTGAITAAFDSTAIDQIDFSDYQLTVGAGPSYTLKRLADGSTIALSQSGTNLVATLPDKLPGISLSISTLPAAGDVFLIRPAYSAIDTLGVNVSDPRKIAAASSLNSSGGALPGDNRNALALAGLENKAAMTGSTETFKDHYIKMITQVGTKTRESKISASAQEVLLNNATEQLSSVSGVNLDEEAAELIKLQQAYQASAQSIATTKTIFETLINATR
jgi:flagellar hook-associated protein 1 FlgK